MAETVELSVDGRGVATVTLDRDSRHNAMDAAMIVELSATLARIRDEGRIRVVVLAPQGRSFCAGGDLDWMRAQFMAGRDVRKREARRLAHLLRDLNTLPKPVIARVQGNAFGGGIGLISCCDVAVGVDDAQFGLTETRLGLIPATISPYVIARMGEGRARRVFMSSRVFDSAEAKELGLLSRLAPWKELDAVVEEEIAPYLAVAPNAVAASKALARRLGPQVDDEIIEETVELLADIWESPEAAEGIAAFFGKREPSWSEMA